MMKPFNFFRRYESKNKDNNLKDSFLNNNISISKSDLKLVSLHITGINNTVTIKKLSKSMKGRVEIWLRGNNNSITIDEGLHVNSKLIITMGSASRNFKPINNSKLTIGRNNSIGNCIIITYNSNASIFIGNNCMFAFDVMLFHTDAHPIMDYETRKIINKVDSLKIGNHVWIGGKATVLKNTVIPDDCIVGYGSIVSGDYIKKVNEFFNFHSRKEGGCIIAGNPAKIIRSGITWDSCSGNGYVQNQREDTND